MLGEAAADLAGVDIARHFEGNPRAAPLGALFQHGRDLSDCRGEECAIALAAHELEADDVLVIVELAFEIGSLERGVADAFDFDHWLPLALPGICIAAGRGLAKRTRCGVRRFKLAAPPRLRKGPASFRTPQQGPACRTTVFGRISIASPNRA